MKKCKQVDKTKKTSKFTKNQQQMTPTSMVGIIIDMKYQRIVFQMKE